ncbi:hypothetical protein [Microbacterium sp. TNHR37B]|uniref:hypothetical protein n=1 Tax=Microbacterium sp. TNHR37B TaxID=1775956 RepID=UPI0007B1B04B|nr:hypothetical protein [Microbacterium sp. TNHR37B]KZE88676.1 hypothetical protein AVP41_03183 [Microbacterium sp. TNHR37B]
MTAAEKGGTRPPPPVRWWLSVLIGVAAALAGLVPWLVTGARLPLQNLGESGVSGDAPVVLLPFSQYSVSSIFAVLVFGAVVAGVAARALRPRSTRVGVWGVLAGVAAVHVVAIVQTAAVVGGDLQDRVESQWYLAGLTGGAVFSALVGWGCLVLVAVAPRAGALLGLAVGAIAAGMWAGAFLRLFPVTATVPEGLLTAVSLVTPVLAGIAIAWTGLATAGRIVASLVTVILVWVAPALATGIFNALGTRALARDPRGMLEYGLGVFRMALFEPALALRPIIATVIVAAVATAVALLLRRRRAPETV